jgi:hypothetical protein
MFPSSVLCQKGAFIHPVLEAWGLRFAPLLTVTVFEATKVSLFAHSPPAKWGIGNSL